MDEWEWQRTLEVNLTGAFLCGQLAGRVMSDEGGGLIVFIVRPGLPEPAAQGRAAFLATQAGLMALAEALDAELSGQGVRVYAVTARTPGETIRAVLALCAAS
jgi:NAD(P)-dependent dehydrogenase (short-subunit alcohol dehydrogenase family)